MDLDRFLRGQTARRTDPISGKAILREDRITKALRDAPRDAAAYISNAMEALPDTYTKNSIAECDRVQAHLARELPEEGHPVEFRHQGSVTNNTHIKLHSDIDLLLITKEFVFKQPPLVVASPYRGDAPSDLLTIRSKAAKVVRRRFPEVDVDDSGGKATALSGGSLRRKIDLVSCAWLDTQTSLASLFGGETSRGIRLYDRNAEEYVDNFPFLHNDRLSSRDDATCGWLKPLIRLAKSVRSDSDLDVKLSSYDIAALAYAVFANPPLAIMFASDIDVCEMFVLRLSRQNQDPAFRANERVPNETRLIYCDGGATVREVEKLCSEIAALLRVAAPKRLPS